MIGDGLVTLAGLLAARNEIDGQIALLTGRPMTSGHLGEYIAAAVFDIQLELSASTAAIDGRFRHGALRDRTVNVKWYLKREGLLDLSVSDALDYYLVMTGPPASAMTSRGGTRPWVISNVYLLDARALLADLRAQGRKVGVASSVRAQVWADAEVYPRLSPRLPLTEAQQQALSAFAPSTGVEHEVRSTQHSLSPADKASAPDVCCSRPIDDEPCQCHAEGMSEQRTGGFKVSMESLERSARVPREQQTGMQDIPSLGEYVAPEALDRVRLVSSIESAGRLKPRE